MLGIGLLGRGELVLQAAEARRLRRLVGRGPLPGGRAGIAGRRELGAQAVAFAFHAREPRPPIDLEAGTLGLEPAASDQPADGEAERRGDDQKHQDLQEKAQGPSPRPARPGRATTPAPERFSTS